MTSSDNLLQSMPHSDFSPKTSIFHRKGDSENVAMSNFPSQTMKWNNQRETDDTTMSNTLAQTTEEPQFIIEPSFSLADDHDVSHDLQTKDVSKTVPSDGSKLASVIDNTSSVSSEQLDTQTMNASFAAVQSSTVPQLSLEPQIYGGSVFSLMDEHAEDTDRNTTPPATRSSVNQNVTDQVCEVQHSAIDQENQADNSQIVQNLPATDTCPVEFLSATSTSDNQPTVFSDTSKVIKEHISSQSSLSNISTSRRDLLSKSTNHQADLASPEQCSEDYSISTTTHSETSPSGSAVSIQSCSVNLEESSGTLGSSHDQPNTDQIRSKSETEGSTILPICDDNKSVSHQDQMIQSHAVTPQVGEVVDLDTEDVDDCLLVKIDFNKRLVPFGLKIHNTEVVIHDSDTDEESVIEPTSEVKEQDLSSKTVSSGDSASLSSKDVGDKCKSPERDVCSNVVISEIDSCELIGSLSMEVDEINSDTDTPYMEVDEIISDTDTPYTEVDEIISDTDTPSNHFMNQSLEPYDCSTEETITASTVVHQSVTISSIRIVSNTIDSNDVADKINSERNNFTVTVTQNSISLDSSLSDCELLELHTDDEMPRSEHKENKKLNVILPSKFSQDNLPNRMSNNKTYSSITHESITDISSSVSTMKNKKLAPQNQGFKNILKQNNPPKIPNKPILGQKSIKRTTRQSKQSSSAKSSKVASNQNISSGQTSAVRTEMASKSSSIMCKICHMSFSARKELFTHTWNTHKHPFNLSYKCKVCNKSFPNSSLLKLHQKVNCSTLGKNANEKRVLPERRLRGVLQLKKNTDISSVFQSYNSVSRTKIGFFDRKNTHNEEVMHECPKCQRRFSNRLQLKKHKTVCDFSKVSESANFNCLLCGLVLTESSNLYHHILNSPRCARKINIYCCMCNNIFKSRADKQAHFNLSMQCTLKEVQFLEKIVRRNGDFRGHNDQNKGNIRDANMTQQAATVQFPSQPQNEQAAAVKFHAHQQNKQIMALNIQVPPQDKEIPALRNKRQPKIVGRACKDIFEIKKLVKLRLSKNCKNEVKQTLQDVKSLNVIKRQQKPINQKNRQEKVSQAENQTEIVNEEKIIQCVICEARFSSQWELFKHSINKKKCSASKSKAATKNIPGSKTLLISLNRVSVICKVCNLVFSDDFKLTEHLQLNPSCHHSEKAHTDIELSSVNNGMVKKYVKKNRSCKIATGISSSTPVIPMLCTSEGDISMQKQPLEELNCKDKQSKNVINLEHLPSTLQQAGLTTEVRKWKESNNDYLDLFKSNSTGLDNSNTMQVYMDNDGCRDGAEEKLSDLSDCDSDIEEDSSANEESDVEYRCKLCSKTFHVRSQFVRHTKLHHPSSKRRSVHCKVCTRKFHDLTDLQAHLLQFQYCFIPLTRKLWESKQDPHLCKMCRRSLQSLKDLRKHCFKNMPCRLRYVNLVIDNIKTKDSSKSLGLFLSESSETEVPSVKTPKMILKNNEDNSGVSSSVQDCDNPQNVNLPPNVGFNSAIPTPETLATSEKECLNCGKVFTDFLEHIFTHQACLNFYGIYKNRCPVSLPFCFQCKQRFDNITMLTKHACKGFVPYTNTCTGCELKFTSMMDLNAHMKTCRKVPVLHSQAKNCLNGKKTVAANPHNNQHHRQHVAMPVVRTCTTKVSVPASSTSKKSQVSVSATSTSKTIHPTEELFPCKICDAKFPLLCLLMKHSYEHEEETPLTCDRCDSVFVRYNQFVSHQTFHIRMDKENGILSAKTQYNEMPPVLEKLDSSDTSNNQKGHNMSDHLSACLFCHQEFPNAVSKVDHISNTPACLGIMKYIIENKFFTKEPSDNLFDEVKTADPNCCEFCKHNFSDKLFHYLQSSCIYRLEKAILRFRAVSCPPESVVTKIAANKTSNVGISSTTNNKSPLLKKHTFYCPICKQSFHDQNNLLIHQRKKHGQLSGRKLPPENQIMKMVDKSDTLFCFTCSKYLRKIKEIENHKSSCKEVTVLPFNIAVKADVKKLMCTICNAKFAVKRTLIDHMIYKHCDETNKLMIAVEQKTSQCAICSKDVLLSKWRSHFQQHKTTYLKKIKAIPTNKKVVCIVCKHHFVRNYIIKHINKHTIASVFRVHSEGGTNVESKIKPSEVAQTEVKQKVRFYQIHDSLDRVCLICRASFSEASLYQAHLETHITPCKIILNDCFDQETSDDENEEMKDIEIIDNFLDDDVKVVIEYDY